jgi:hypothetical protein
MRSCMGSAKSRIDIRKDRKKLAPVGLHTEKTMVIMLPRIRIK